jgi:hypothetical protein
MTPMLLPALLALASPAQEAVSNLSLVPADALVVAHVDDLPALRGAIAQSSFTRLLTAPDGLLPQADLGDLRTILDPAPTPEALAALPDELRQVLEILSCLKGQATVYLTRPALGTEAGASDEPVFGLLLEPKTSAAEFQALMQRLVAAQEQITFVERGGMLAAVPTRSLIDPSAFEAGMIFANGHFALVGGDEAAPVKAEFERLLARLGGGAGQGIEQNPRFQAAQRSMSGPAQARFFVDLEPLVDLMMAEMEQDSMPMPAAMLMSRSGLEQLSYLSARMHIGALESTEFELFMPYQQDTILGMLLGNFGPASLEHLRRVPQDAINVSAGSFDVFGLYEDGLSLADEIEEGMGEMARAQVDAASSFLGFDIEADLITQLAGPLVMYQPARSATEPRDELRELLASSGLDSVWLLSLREPETVEGVLLDLVELAAAESGEEFGLVEFAQGGRKLWRIEAGSAGELPLALGFSPAGEPNGVLAIGIDTNSVAKSLADPASSSTSVLDHQKLGPLLRANLGRGPLAVGDTARTLQSFYEAISSLGAAAGALEGLGAESFGDGSELEGWLSQADPSAIGRYLSGTSLQVMETGSAGLRISYVTR